MRKKAILAEKLRKISEGDTTTPLFKRRMLKDKLRDREKEVSTRAEKKSLPTVIDFGLPESKVKGFLRVETSSQEGELVQTLYSLDNPKKRVKWTVLEDPQGGEFDTIKEEGLTKVKDYPPIYVYETGDGALLASHVGGFTFTVGGTLVSTRELIAIFSLGLNQAKKLDLRVSPLEKELEESSERIKELKRKLNKNEAKIKILEGKSTYSDEMEDELGRKDKVIVAKSAEAEKLKEKGAKLKSDIVYLKNLLKEYKASIDDKDRIIAEQKLRIDEMGKEETQVSTALYEKRELESRVEVLEKDLQDKAKLTNSMKAELDILRESVKDTLVDKDKSLAFFIDQSATLEAKVNELEALLDDKEKIISIQNEELDSARERVTSLKEELGKI